MDANTKLLIGLCILIPLVLVINLALLSVFRRRKENGESGVFTQARNSLQHPFQEEDEQLNELSKRVSELKHKDDSW